MLSLSDVSAAVGLTLMKWVYTDRAEIPNDETFLIELVKTAQKYRLKELKERYLRSTFSLRRCKVCWIIPNSHAILRLERQ